MTICRRLCGHPSGLMRSERWVWSSVIQGECLAADETRPLRRHGYRSLDICQHALIVYFGDVDCTEQVVDI